MPDEQSTYRVKADLVLDATKAQRQATQMQGKIQALGRRITGTSSLAGGLTRNLIAIGGAYLGINVLSRAFMSATSSAITYTAELEKTQIALTSVLAAVTNSDWATAQKTAGKVFEQVRQDSIKSVATAQELFSIYQGIVGPIVAAGKGLDVVRKITKDAVNASGVLGVDLEQARRDISMMARGTAGVDVKLFSMLRSTGAIAETTEEWNNNLTAGERIEKLEAALAKFAPSGERFAKSWAGVTSTFKGIRQEFTRSAMEPVLKAMGGSLLRINTILIDNQDVVQKRLQQWGESFANRLGSVFAKAESGINMMVNRWDEVLAKINQVKNAMTKAGKVAGAVAIAQMARPLVGAAVGGVGAIAGSMAASTATATAAGAGGGAGAAAAGTAGMAALGPALAVAAAGAGLLTGAVLVVREQMIPLHAMFLSMRPIMLGLWDVMKRLGIAVGGILLPIFKVFGNVLLAFLVPAFLTALSVMRVVVGALAFIAEGWALLANLIYSVVKPAFDALFGFFDRLTTKIMMMIGMFTGDTGRYNRRKVLGTEEDPLKAMAEQMGREEYKAPWERGFGEGSETPGARATVVNDFRGSKIEVKQTFRDMDPDRVMVAMVKGLARQADMRIQSGMVPALGR